MAVLRLIQGAAGNGAGVYRLGDVTILGRAAPSHVILPNPSVSKQHARITSSDRGWLLEDMGSVNGTFINGERVDSALLRDGDIIRVHRFVLEFAEHARRDAASPRTIAPSATRNGATLMATRPYEDLFGLPSTKDTIDTLRGRLKAIYEVSRAAVGTFSTEALFDVSLDELLHIFDQADYAYVLMKEPGTGDVAVAASRKRDPSGQSLAPSGTVIEHAYRTREAVLSASAMDDPRFHAAQSIVGSFTASVLCAPIVVGQNVFGVIYIATRQARAPFGEDDLQLLVCVAATLATFIQNVRLHEKALERERMAAALGVAREIQLALLPAESLRRGEYAVAGLNLPCDETGGDYYDFLELADGRIAVIVGDVSGHGIGSALIMAEVRALFHAMLGPGADPIAVMTAVNGMLSNDLRKARFVTLFLRLLDTRKHEISYVSAGHPPTLLADLSTGHVLQFEASTLPLGIFRKIDAEYHEPVVMPEHSLLLCYTDGVVERMNSAREQFGMERLKALLKDVSDLPPEDIVITVEQAEQRFAGTSERVDDVTVVAVKREARQAGHPGDLRPGTMPTVEPEAAGPGR